MKFPGIAFVLVCCLPKLNVCQDLVVLSDLAKAEQYLALN